MKLSALLALGASALLGSASFAAPATCPSPAAMDAFAKTINHCARGSDAKECAKPSAVANTFILESTTPLNDGGYVAATIKASGLQAAITELRQATVLKAKSTANCSYTTSNPKVTDISIIKNPA